MRKKIIYQVEPYNRFALRDCYYSMIFPIVNYYGGSADVLAVATNNDVVFVFENNRFKGVEQYRTSETLRGYLLEQGVYLEEDNLFHAQIVDVVCKLLDQGYLVIISLSDAISYDPENGNKTGSHGGYGHWVLFHGYNRDARFFNVIDHFSVESPIYCNLSLSFDELVRSYYEHENLFGSKLQLFSKNDESLPLPLLKKKYLDEWKTKRNEHKGDSIKSFLKYLNTYFNSDYQTIRRRRFFVAEDLGHLGVYYIQQRFIINSLFPDRKQLKRIDNQTELILKIKHLLLKLKPVDSENELSLIQSAYEYVKELIDNGNRIESIINRIAEEGDCFGKENSNDY